MSRGITIAELAGEVGVAFAGDGRHEICRVAPLHLAGPDAVTFLSSPRYRHQLAETRAGAVVLAPDDAAGCPTAVLISDNPYATYARIAQRLHPARRPPAGVHASAVVGAGSRLADGVSVGPCAVIGERCRIAERVVIGPGCVVGDDVSLGADTRLVSRVTVCHDVQIGARVLVQPGAVIGADGFGFANEAGSWVKIPQLGSVVIGDDVEVGANTTIDRGTLEDTVIGDGVKLDNLVMVAHNVRIGAGSALAGCVGIAGSAVLGERCTIGGGVGITGHIEVTDDVHVTGMSFVNRSVEEPGAYSSGMPLQGNLEWRKNMVRLKQLDDLARRLAVLERQRNKG